MVFVFSGHGFLGTFFCGDISRATNRPTGTRTFLFLIYVSAPTHSAPFLFLSWIWTDKSDCPAPHEPEAGAEQGGV